MTVSQARGYLEGEWHAIDALLNLWWNYKLSKEEVTLRVRYLELVERVIVALKKAHQRTPEDPVILTFCETILSA